MRNFKFIVQAYTGFLWSIYETETKLISADTFHILEQFKRDINVATKTNKSNSTAQTKWANANLSVEDQHTITELVDSNTDPLEYLLRCVADGCSFSIKFRADKNDYLAFLFEPDDDNPKITYGLSAFATDIRTALVVLAYKHDNICGGHVANAVGESSSFG